VKKWKFRSEKLQKLIFFARGFVTNQWIKQNELLRNDRCEVTMTVLWRCCVLLTGTEGQQSQFQFLTDSAEAFNSMSVECLESGVTGWRRRRSSSGLGRATTLPFGSHPGVWIMGRNRAGPLSGRVRIRIIRILKSRNESVNSATTRPGKGDAPLRHFEHCHLSHDVVWPMSSTDFAWYNRSVYRWDSGFPPLSNPRGPRPVIAQNWIRNISAGAAVALPHKRPGDHWQN
jgi:hypothetical protein